MNPEQNVLFINCKQYSRVDLLNEVQRGTRFGRQFERDMLECMTVVGGKK